MTLKKKKTAQDHEYYVRNIYFPLTPEQLQWSFPF